MVDRAEDVKAPNPADAFCIAYFLGATKKDRQKFLIYGKTADGTLKLYFEQVLLTARDPVRFAPHRFNHRQSPSRVPGLRDDLRAFSITSPATLYQDQLPFYKTDDLPFLLGNFVTHPNDINKLMFEPMGIKREDTLARDINHDFFYSTTVSTHLLEDIIVSFVVKQLASGRRYVEVHDVRATKPCLKVGEIIPPFFLQSIGKNHNVVLAIGCDEDEEIPSISPKDLIANPGLLSCPHSDLVTFLEKKYGELPPGSRRGRLLVRFSQKRSGDTILIQPLRGSFLDLGKARTLSSRLAVHQATLLLLPAHPVTVMCGIHSFLELNAEVISPKFTSSVTLINSPVAVGNYRPFATDPITYGTPNQRFFCLAKARPDTELDYGKHFPDLTVVDGSAYSFPPLELDYDSENALAEVNGVVLKFPSNLLPTARKILSLPSIERSGLLTQPGHSGRWTAVQLVVKEGLLVTFLKTIENSALFYHARNSLLARSSCNHLVASVKCSGPNVYLQKQAVALRTLKTFQQLHGDKIVVFPASDFYINVYLPTEGYSELADELKTFLANANKKLNLYHSVRHMGNTTSLAPPFVPKKQWAQAPLSLPPLVLIT